MKKKINYCQLLISGICVLPITNTLTSCSHDKYIEYDFCSDSWENIVYWANQGADALLKRYYRSVYGNIIGMERILTIEGVDHIVKVIGMNNDYIADTNGKPTGKLATLTFQFEQTCSYRVYSEEYDMSNIVPYTIGYYKNEDEIPESDLGYKNSLVRECLNNYMFDLFPKALRNKDGIKTVSKLELLGESQLIQDKESQTKLVEVGEKLFSLSLAEVFPQEYFAQDGFDPIFAQEGYIYDWYQIMHNISGPYDLSENNPIFTKWSAAGIMSGTCGWFLRTPGLYSQFSEEGLDYLVTHWAFSGIGTACASPGMLYEECLLPCFCI